MPFGLKNAAQAFQRLMDKVCQGLARVFVYLHDIPVASEDRHQDLWSTRRLRPRHQTHQVCSRRLVHRFPRPPRQCQRYCTSS